MGVTVRTNRHGYLCFRVIWRRRDEHVGTKYRDDGPNGRNRRRVEVKAEEVEEKLREGVELHHALLDVVHDCPPRLMPEKPPEPPPLTLRAYYEKWIETKTPPLVRASTARRHRSAFVSVILPAIIKLSTGSRPSLVLGETPLREMNKEKIETFRMKLLSENTRRGTKRTLKATRNIIDWHLRALWRDAEREGHVGPFPKLDWPRVRKPRPDPFEPEERDKILAWFHDQEPAWYPWLHFLFWTGVRPGEAAALRWGDVDLKRGSVSITKSRDEREESDPKTEGSIRDVKLLPWAFEMLRRLPRPLHSDGSEYVFSTPEGKPMTDTWWPKRGAARRPDPSKPESLGMWYRCLRSLGLRPRKAYTTRHTFIAWALSEGTNLKGLAEYCGTSVEMIDKSYGKYVRKDFLAPLVEAMSEPVLRPKIAVEHGDVRRENRNLGRNLLPVWDQITGRSGGYRMEAGGIEPLWEGGFASRDP